MPLYRGMHEPCDSGYIVIYYQGVERRIHKDLANQVKILDASVLEHAGNLNYLAKQNTLMTMAKIAINQAQANYKLN